MNTKFDNEFCRLSGRSSCSSEETNDDKVHDDNNRVQNDNHRVHDSHDGGQNDNKAKAPCLKTLSQVIFLRYRTFLIFFYVCVNF